ncbi:nuclear transport factor 2 family protein [Sphaerisporangium dianthi]|uniref:Nuclear transport factor 2 family protein n=1 Tax=Sphaerisporangium dianthi TaxID=1436120 RepID=A0ABV9CKW5_9ACTN
MAGTRTTPATDLAGYLTRYPHEIAFGDEEPETVMDRYHTSDYELVNDGIVLDRKRLLDHIRPARKRATAVQVEVEVAIVDGDRVAAWYRLIASMRKGSVIATEIHMFGRLADDGRLRRATQLTRTIPATDDQAIRL